LKNLRENPLSYQLEGRKKEPLVPGNEVRFGEREAARYRRRGGWLSKDSKKFHLVNSASARLSHFNRSARSGLVLVERHFSLEKRHKICSLELITEEWWLDFLELEKNFFAWAAYVQGCSDPLPLV